MNRAVSPIIISATKLWMSLPFHHLSFFLPKIYWVKDTSSTYMGAACKGQQDANFWDRYRPGHGFCPALVCHLLSNLFTKTCQNLNF